MARDDSQTLARPQWPEHGRLRMAAYFRLFRHLRVVRARTMRHLHKRKLDRGGLGPQPVSGAYAVAMWPDWSDRTFAYCHYGTYGSYLSAALAAIDQPFAFLDIGANQGLYSLVASCNPQCRKVVSLEPVPATYAKLQRNVAVNTFEDRATLINAALADRTGTAEIALKPEHSGAATLRGGTDFGGTSQSIRLISIAELDPLLPSDLPLFVKIDVEGLEPVVIRQLLRSAHAERIFALFYEMDERWSDAGEVRDLLRDNGFGRTMKYGIGRHYDMLATRDGI